MFYSVPVILDIFKGTTYSEDFSEKHEDPRRTLVQHLTLSDLCDLLNRCNEAIVNFHTSYRIYFKCLYL